MRNLPHPIKVSYVSPTGRETEFTQFTYFDGDVLWDNLGRAMKLSEAEEIKEGKRPWLKITDSLPTRGSR